MKITSKLCINYLKKNKKRTAGTIFGVVLVTVFITLILIIFSSYQAYRIKTARSKGNWEARFNSIKYSDAFEIAKYQNVKEVSVWYDYGMSDESIVESKTSITRVHLFGYSEEKLKNTEAVKEGRMPQNPNEIIIYNNRINDRKIGDELQLTFEGQTKKYTIVGFSEEPLEGDNEKSHFQDGKDNRIGAITLLNKEKLQDETIINAGIITKNPKEIYKTARNISETLNLNEMPVINKVTEIDRSQLEEVPGAAELYQSVQALLGDTSDMVYLINPEDDYGDEKIEYNKELLSILGVYEGDNKEYYSLLKIEAVILSIVGILGISLIITSFTITYRERTKEIGMLSSIGMSKTQIRNMCFKEGSIIALIGIPIGILIGYILSVIIAGILNKIIKSVGKMMIFTAKNLLFTIDFPIQIIALVVILIYIIIIISSMLSLRKKNIIEKIKGNGKRRTKKSKTPFIIRKLFKQEGKIGYEYAKKEKSRHKTIAYSIMISILVFLVANGIISNFLDIINELKYDDYKIFASTEDVNNIIKYLEDNNLMNGYFVQVKGLQLKAETKSSYSDKHDDKNFEIVPYYLNEKAYAEILEKARIKELKDNECILVKYQKTDNIPAYELANYKVRR